MNLGIYSIEKTLFSGEAEKVIARTPLGQITVLNDHLPIISEVTGPHLEIIQKNEERVEIKLRSGFIEVRPHSEVAILVNA